jgi:diaminopimelate epimerase
MVMYNSDGSRPEMCGNGIRCFAKFVYDKGIVKKSSIAVETDAGIMNIEIKAEGNIARTAIVNMGQPDFSAAKIPVTIQESEVINHEIDIEGKKFKITSMRMGVPHTVVFVDSLEDETVVRLGSIIENSEYFPQKTNVNFVKVLDRENIILRTWERGAGYTYACGTGACASVAAGIVNNLTQEKVKVQLRGGDLVIHWKDRADIYMEGPATEVFEGICLNS